MIGLGRAPVGDDRLLCAGEKRIRTGSEIDLHARLANLHSLAQPGNVVELSSGRND
jgi:hypothetical protein